MNEKTKVYNVIIMDRSGSMWSIQKPAINGYNEVLGGVKAAARNYSDTQEQFFTLVLFDSTSIDEVYWNVPVEEAQILTEKTYVPGASTPLYDAMGVTFSLSISNVIKFEKTGEDTARTFREEGRSRDRWMKKLDEYRRSNPNATKEERIRFNEEIAKKYYDKEETD